VHAAHVGFLVLPWLEGTPLRRGAPVTGDVARAVADYLVRRAAALRTGEPVAAAELACVVAANVRAVPGAGDDAVRAVLRAFERPPPREAAVVDGRLRPFEWVRGPAGIAKVDALDHGDGIRGPGPVDPAWDVAAAAVEFGFPRAWLDSVIERSARAAGDDPREVARAVAAYAPAYAA